MLVIGVEVLRSLAVLREFEVADCPVLHVLQQDRWLVRADAIHERKRKIRCAVIGQRDRRLRGSVAVRFKPGAAPRTAALEENAVASSIDALIGAIDRLPGAKRTEAIVAVAARL